jgi:putative transposase
VKETDDEGFAVQRGTDYRHDQGAGGRDADCRGLPQAWHQQCHVHKYKAKYGGMDVSEARRLKALEDENARLKKLLAEAMLDNAMLKDLSTKKW